MKVPAKRTTIYLEPDLYKALRLKSITVSQSISELVNDTVRQSLAEDAEDITALEERENEPVIGYDEMVKRFRKDVCQK